MILHLFHKPERYRPMAPKEELELTPEGIRGAVHAAPMRHILLVPASTHAKFAIRPGDLRENVVVDDAQFGGLHSLASGTALRLGAVKLRLTIHCEPCPRMNPVVKDYRLLNGYRGYLATILSSGTIRIGDAVVVGDVEFESIPFDLKERIAWYLSKQLQAVPLKTLLYDVGLSISYSRAMPRLLDGIPGARQKVIFGKEAGQASLGLGL